MRHQTFLRASSWLLAGGVLAAASFLVGSAAQADSATQPSGGTVIPSFSNGLVIPRTQKPPKIDGVIDESEWANAASTGHLVGPFGTNGAMDLTTDPSYATEVKMMWDPTHLYLLFICHGGDAWNERTKHNDELYKADVSEFFLDVVGDMKSYVELQGNPRSATGSYAHFWDPAPTYPADKLDWGQMKNMKNDEHWMLDGFAVAAKPMTKDGKPDGWMIEWSVPMTAILEANKLPSTLHAGQVLKGNLFRYEYPPGVLDTKGERRLHQFNWSPTVMGCPHVSPMAMRPIVLGDEK